LPIGRRARAALVTFVTYPNTYHDFDVQDGFSGVSKSTEVFTKYDMVVDVSVGRVIRLNHVDDPKVSSDQVRAYLGSCPGHGANYAFNPTARQCGREGSRFYQAVLAGLRMKLSRP
jgi:hypothetical protein